MTKCYLVQLQLIPPKYEEEFEERAAIMEFDGGVSREEASGVQKLLNRDAVRQHLCPVKNWSIRSF